MKLRAATKLFASMARASARRSGNGGQTRQHLRLFQPMLEESATAVRRNRAPHWCPTGAGSAHSTAGRAGHGRIRETRCAHRRRTAAPGSAFDEIAIVEDQRQHVARPASPGRARTTSRRRPACRAGQNNRHRKGRSPCLRAHLPHAHIGMIDGNVMTFAEGQAEQLAGGVECGRDHIVERRDRASAPLRRIHSARWRNFSA